MTRSQSDALLVEQAPPRVAVVPAPTRANAWEDVSDLSASFGVVLDDWQDFVLQSVMGERTDGTWAADVVGLSVPRQNGKSQLLVARALAGALLFGEEKIIISAHSQDTAREAFSKLLDMRDNSPALAERVDKVMTALNREYVKFKNGAVIQFKARTISGSRGFSCDCLLLDEAQILGMPAWVSIRSTMSARTNPQAWLLGTPPTPEDNGEVFGSVRDSALAGRTRRTAWLEWSALPTDDPAADETRAGANPAWWTRINHEVVQGEFETYPPARFALDRLGIWRTDQVAQLVPSDVWNQLATKTPPNGDPAAFAVDMSHAREVAIGVCVRGEKDHVEVAASDVVPGDTLGVVEWLVQRAGRKIPVVIDSMSPAASLVPALKERRVRVTVTSAADMAKACGDWFDSVTEARLTHFGQAQLDGAVLGAQRRSIGQAGGWGLDRKNPDVNIAPLVAVVLALHGARTNKPRTGRVVTA